jgi:hypothetical protein
MLYATAEAMRTEMSEETLSLWSFDLAHLPDELIEHALARIRREIGGRDGYPPVWTLRDVLDRAGVVNPVGVIAAAPLAAWDQAVEYARLYVINDTEGQWVERPITRLVKRVEMIAHPMYRRKGEGLVQIGKIWICRCMPVHTSRTEKLPKLDQRLRDTVRRIGGWGAIKRMDPVHDLPFVQRRFAMAYEAWEVCEQLSTGSLSNGGLRECFNQLAQNSEMPH